MAEKREEGYERALKWLIEGADADLQQIIWNLEFVHTIPKSKVAPNKIEMVRRAIALMIQAERILAKELGVAEGDFVSRLPENDNDNDKE